MKIPFPHAVKEAPSAIRRYNIAEGKKNEIYP